MSATGGKEKNDCKPDNTELVIKKSLEKDNKSDDSSSHDSHTCVSKKYNIFTYN